MCALFWTPPDIIYSLCYTCWKAFKITSLLWLKNVISFTLVFLFIIVAAFFIVWLIHLLGIRLLPSSTSTSSSKSLERNKMARMEQFFKQLLLHYFSSPLCCFLFSLEIASTKSWLLCNIIAKCKIFLCSFLTPASHRHHYSFVVSFSWFLRCIEIVLSCFYWWQEGVLRFYD